MNKKYLIITGLITLAIITTGCSKITIGNITIQKKSDYLKEAQNTPPNKAEEKIQNTDQTTDKIEIIQDAINQTSTLPVEQNVVPEKTLPSNSIIDCKTDINCLENRAKNCEKTKFTLILPWEMSPGIMYNIINPYEITGINNGQCNFNYKAGQFEIKVADSALADYMKQHSLDTSEEAKKNIEEANQNSTKLTALIECYTAEGKNITIHIKNLLDGKATLSQTNDEMVYENNVYCKQIIN